MTAWRDQTARLLGMPCVVNYDLFIDTIIALRMARLSREQAACSSDRVRWLMYQDALNVLQFEREAL